MRILLLDNFDSFTLNIAQYLDEVTGRQPVVAPNTTPYDRLPLAEVDAVVISPGPGRPSRPADFGVCREVIARCGLPMLGVCLGHQGIAEHFGARTVRAPQPAHGVVDTIKHAGTGLFAGLPQDLPVVRYHSLVTVDVPDELEVTAWTGDGLVMAFAHRTRPIWGVQFHPESIETRGGRRILANFAAAASSARPAPTVRSAASVRSAAPVRSETLVRSAALVRSASPAVPVAAEHPVVRAFRRVGGATRPRLRLRRLDQPPPPAELFRARYAGHPHAFWLDAEHGDGPRSRYSLMGAAGDPGSVVLRYDLATRRLALTGFSPGGSGDPPGERVEQVTGDVFALLAELLAAVDPDVPAGWPLPFTGGLVGWFGYELKALAGGDERHRGVEPDAWFVHAREFVVYDHELGHAYDCRLSDSSGSWMIDAPIGAPVIQDLPRFAPGPVPHERLDLRHGRAEYLRMVAAAQRLIRAGETYEVCLTNRASVRVEPDAPGSDGLAAYLRMRRVSPVPYGAYLRCAETEVLSCSPETFLRVTADRVVESRPIKGTRPRGATPDEDEALRQRLLRSAKDRAENLMIVDLVRHDLNAVCERGSVHVPAAFVVESYSSVHQLVSTVRGRLRPDVSALEAVRACFPAGSMTGAPKKRTMEIIDELEGGPRGVYSGAVGWLSFGGAVELSVVIRTAVVRGGTATFGVGGAVTARSDPAEEFEETLVKASVPYFGLRGWRPDRDLPCPGPVSGAG